MRITTNATTKMLTNAVVGELVKVLQDGAQAYGVVLQKEGTSPRVGFLEGTDAAYGVLKLKTFSSEATCLSLGREWVLDPIIFSSFAPGNWRKLIPGCIYCDGAALKFMLTEHSEGQDIPRWIDLRTMEATSKPAESAAIIVKTGIWENEEKFVKYPGNPLFLLQEMTK
ncbi:hypothetical protein RHE_CH01999 [Rhizobium etli CFN 42]|uniref:Uncharacterized protein n=1 Tax=Rhizobium etli (strain ATCC 51251 / DSM 11541 / JCM 21823 / NBRC 15573 / CFN 42) TaxID=347834 RepID=Q2K8Q2_RHIEC|nr:hypothetical protein [Rhizobium etli]ABC90784.1 hypothetical protein RHE_CH01999 [Rhizobium etli CFN 42]